MPPVPMIRPLPGQSTRSLVTLTLRPSTSPHWTSAATGGGLISHVQSAVATFPSTSVALTVNVCLPTASPLYSRGDVQAPNAPPSSAQARLAPRSLAENSNVAPVCTVVRSGPDVIFTSGGTPTASTSTHHLLVAGERSTLPARSTARTWNSCEPTGRSYSAGEVQGAHASPSSEHWNVTVLALSLPSKRKTCVPPLLGSGGVSSSWVVGAMMSLCGAGPPSQRIVKHCSGFSVIGSSGPRLPCALLPPPSMLCRPFEPSLAQMPQPPLSLAMFALTVWVTFET